MSCYGDDNSFSMECNGCFNCDPIPKVKGRFGVAWICETPNCPCNERLGWEVKFLDTPHNIEQNCKEMVQWANCPPLPRCYPCPPSEIYPSLAACASNCSPYLSKYNVPKCTCYYKKSKRVCCRNKSQHKQIRFSNCNQTFSSCSCCDDIPVKDTSNGSHNSSSAYNMHTTSSEVTTQQMNTNIRSMNKIFSTLFENCNKFKSNDNNSQGCPNNASSSGASCCCFNNAPQTIPSTKQLSTNTNMFQERNCICGNCTNCGGFGSKSTSTIEKNLNICSECNNNENGYYSEGAAMARKPIRFHCNYAQFQNNSESDCNQRNCDGACKEVKFSEDNNCQEIPSSQSCCNCNCNCEHNTCNCQIDSSENSRSCTKCEPGVEDSGDQILSIGACSCGSCNPDEKLTLSKSSQSNEPCPNTNLENEFNNLLNCESKPQTPNSCTSVISSKSGLHSCKLINDESGTKSLLDLLECDCYNCDNPTSEHIFETCINACPSVIVGDESSIYPNLKDSDSICPNLKGIESVDNNEEKKDEGKKKRKGKNKLKATKSPVKTNCLVDDRLEKQDSGEKRRWFNFRCWKHKDSSVELKGSKE